MGKYIVTKDMLNVRNKPSLEDESFIGTLRLGEEVELLDEPIAGETPPGTDDNMWLADTMNRVLSRAGVAGAGTYAARKAAFLADEFNRPFYDPDDSANEDKWKVSWGHVDLEIWRLWKEFDTKGRGIKVAVIDDGCWHSENCLQDRLSSSSKCIVGDTLEEFDPSHGTHSAGLIGAAGEDVFGVAPECELIVLKAGSNGAFDPIDLGTALMEALKLEPDIISISISSFDDAFLRQAVASCVQKQGKPILIFASAGNKVSSIKRFPASYDRVFSIGAYILNGNAQREILRSSSNPEAAIKLLAPGNHLRSVSKTREASFYGETSAATAFAAGVFALILSICRERDINFEMLIEKFTSNACCDKIEPDIQNNPFEGFGVVNPHLLIGLLKK